MSVAYPFDVLPSFTSGCAAKGRFLAFATILPVDEGWQLSYARSRLFQLEDRSAQYMRNLAVEIHKFASEQEIENVAFCRRSVQDIDDQNSDEVRIEALLSVIPGLETEIYEHDIVSTWVARDRPDLPENIVRSQLVYPQRRAIEMAQFIMILPYTGE